MPRLLDRDTAARYCAVSRDTLDRLRADGELPTVKLGRRVLFDVADLDDLIDRRKTTRAA